MPRKQYTKRVIAMDNHFLGLYNPRNPRAEHRDPVMRGFIKSNLVTFITYLW